RSVQRVDRAQVGAFVPVTFQTGECEIDQDGEAAMLYGDQMINLVSKWRVALVQQAVFAALSRRSITWRRTSAGTWVRAMAGQLIGGCAVRAWALSRIIKSLTCS